MACAGPLLAAELDALGRALAAPARPLVAIVAGSKVSTKLTILRTLAAKVDTLIVGGGIANTFILATGGTIGKSLAEPDLVGEARAILAALSRQGAACPSTSCARRSSRADAAAADQGRSTTSRADDLILDIGPRTVAALANDHREGRERSSGTARSACSSSTPSPAARARSPRRSPRRPRSRIAGGGDTLAAIAKFGVADRIGYISTGGGAFLEFLEGQELPAVAALEARALR